MKKIILFLITYLFYSNTVHSITDFANEDATLIIGNLSGVQSSQLKIVTPANITGWTQDSIVKSFVSNATSWTESYTAGVVIGTGRKSAPSNMILNNSSAIIAFASPSNSLTTLNRANSNVLANLPNNSSAIAALARLELNNSNDLVTLPRLIRTISNTILNFNTMTVQIKNQSNSILTLYPKVRANSQATGILSRRVIGNSNALASTILPLVRFNSNALMSNLYYANSNAANFLQRNFPVQLISGHSHFAANTTISNLNLYQAGLSVKAGKTLTLNTPLPVNGNIGLNGTGVLSLGGDLYLGSNAYLTSAGTIIGNGYSLIMTDSLYLPPGTSWQITSSLMINGNGNTLAMGHNAQLWLASNASLTLKNMNIVSSPNNPIIPIFECFKKSGVVTLDNVTISLAGNFSFYDGLLFFYNDVRFTGTSSFIYQSEQASYVTPQSLLTFDPGTSFIYAPSSSNVDLFQLLDKSSGIYLKGSGTSLATTSTGMRLTKGRLWVDNKVSFNTDATATLVNVTTVINTTTPGTNDASRTVIFGTALAWSPNNQYLARAEDSVGSTTAFTLYSFNGTSLQAIATATEPLTDNYNYTSSIIWHPSGNYVASANARTGYIYIYSFDGTTLTQVSSVLVGLGMVSAPNAGAFSGIAWSPNGNYIAASTTAQLEIFSFNSITGAISGSPIAINGYGGTYSGLYYGVGGAFSSFVPTIAWHPDGTVLAIGTGAGAGVSGGMLRIYTFDGSSLTYLTGQNWSFSTQAQIWNVAWDPTGRYLSVAGNSWAFSYPIAIYSFNGSTISLVTGLTGLASNNFSTSWDPSGQYVTFCSDTSPKLSNIYYFNGSTLTLVNSSGVSGVSSSWSSNGRFIAMTGWSTSPSNSSSFTINATTFSFATSASVTNDGRLTFGNANLGSNYDLDVFLLSGAHVEVDGTLFYNNVN